MGEGGGRGWLVGFWGEDEREEGFVGLGELWGWGCGGGGGGGLFWGLTGWRLDFHAADL